MSSQHPMLTREIRTTERGVRVHYVRLDGSAVGATAGTAGVLLGWQHVHALEAAAGHYTLSLLNPGERILGAVAVGESATVASMATIVVTDKATLEVYHWDAAGAALADEDLYIQIHVSTAADET